MLVLVCNVNFSLLHLHRFVSLHDCTTAIKCAHSQVTRENVQSILARLSEIVSETLRNPAQQTAENLLLIANVLESATNFIIEFDIEVTQNVSPSLYPNLTGTVI